MDIAHEPVVLVYLRGGALIPGRVQLLLKISTDISTVQLVIFYLSSSWLSSALSIQVADFKGFMIGLQCRVDLVILILRFLWITLIKIGRMSPS